MYTLAACAEMLFLDQPIQERARRLHDLGFQVEIWDWTRHDLAALARTGAVFSSMTGYIRGSLTDQDGAAELLRTAAESVSAAQRLGCPRLNLHGTGLDEAGLPVRPVTGEPNWARAPGSPSPWRTSTPSSTTPACRSRRPPTPWPWSRPSIAPDCG